MSERRPKTETELLQQLRAIDARAPQELHDRIDVLLSGRAPARRHPPLIGWQVAGGLALAAAVAVLVLVIAAGGGGSRLTMHEAVALTLRPSTAPAPAEDRGTGRLAVSVGGVAFPDWEDLGWRATGVRTDRAGGRMVTTVFYANARGQRVGYAIVAGTPAPAVGGGAVSWRDGRRYRLLVQDASHVVSWQRDGHLCVVSGRGVDSATLLALAGWQEDGRTAS